MPFGTIVGHRHVLDLLSRAVARQSLPPSLILQGPDGVGKRQVALALAQVVNCLRPVQGSAATGLAIDACGTCSPCLRIARGTHPDVLTVDQEGVHPEVVRVDVKDDSAIIPVGFARELTRLAGYRPYEARRRFIVFDPADAMEARAQDALLKALEEPASTTVFILVTSQPDVLRPTVRSRCPQIRFGPLTVSEIADVLMRDGKLRVDEARAAAVLASGSVARALEAASEDTSEARSQALHVLRDAANIGDCQSLVERMKLVLGVEKRQGSAASEREQLSVTLQAMSSMLRDLALLAASRQRAGQAPAVATDGAENERAGALRELANADLKDDLEQLLGRFGRERLMRAYGAVDRALGALRGNTSAKLVVDWLGCQL